MDWTQVWTIVGANIGLAVVLIGTTITLFLWARSEASEDRREMTVLLRAIQDEMKDFHGRLCSTEQKIKGD